MGYLKTYLGNPPATGISGTSRTVTDYTATAGQTTFSAIYAVGYVDVYQNGAKLGNADYTATNGTSIVLATGAASGDLIEIVGYSTMNVAGSITSDSFSGNGTTTAFTMTSNPANSNSVLVVISGVTQDPSTYTVSGTTLTFSTAPPTGTNNISARYLGLPSTTSVSSFSAGTTGLTPSTSSTGAITLGGTLAVTNGGTGQTSFTAGQIHYGSFSTSSSLTFDGTSLGVGTATPNKAALASAITVNNANAGNYSSLEIATADTERYRVSANSGTVYQIISGTSPFITYTNGAERMRIDSSGQVSIGNTSASAFLDVGPTASPSIPAAILRGGAGIGNTGGLGLYTNDSSANARNWGLASNTSVYGDFSIYQGSAVGSNPFTGTNRFYIGLTGNVGIGTTSPTEKLTIVGNYRGADSSGNGVQIVNTTTPYIQAFASAGINDLQLNAKTLQFATGASYGAATERLRITANGGVSFGASGTAYGSSGQVLTSNGDAPPSWGAVTLPAGTVKQVVNVIKNDIFTTTSTTFVDVTGLSATITPTSATSKILVQTTMNVGGTNGTYHCYFILVKNGTMISAANGSTGSGGTSAPNGGLCMLHKNINDNRDMDCAVMNYLDSPATTSAVTYKIQMAVQLNTFYINRAGSGDVWNPSGISGITLWEIAA